VAAGGVVRSLSSVLPAIVALLLLAVLRQLLRSTWAAVLVTLALTSAMFGDVSSPTGVALSLPFMALLLGVLIRLGLLSAATALTVHHLLAHTFMTTHLTAWYADSAVAGILATLALAAWGFYAAIGARSSGARRAGPS
jgi:cellobiose-specific phosphotransferase system component IIC